MKNNDLICQEILKKIDSIQDEELANLILTLINNQDDLNNSLFIDPLTEIYNRRIINEIKNYSIIVMCDIDNFKYINDTYEHLIGDEILKFVAKILS